MPKNKKLRFSGHFNINKSQAELDFVDIPLDTDIRLFVDPYALTVAQDEWLKACGDMVVNYFQKLVNAIRKNDTTAAMKLLSNLHEPNDTHLGLSRGTPSGRGVGSGQAQDLHDTFARSKAVKTGKLRDLTDCELMIPGISSDKISDVTINIIRAALIEYTEQQCAMLKIPLENVASGLFWNPKTANWENSYVNLPVYNDERIVLVPKAAVRYRLAANHAEYYRRYVLEFLQAEHLNANSSLVHVLQNGKRVVYKKDLQKEISKIGGPFKDYLFEFSEKHPEVLDRYKKSLKEKNVAPEDEGLELIQPHPEEIDVSELQKRLRSIHPGSDAASEYHNFILGALVSIFYPKLYKPKKEQEINEGRKRIDITFNNRLEPGFFQLLNSAHKIHSPYVFFECKNYTHEIGNKEFDQLLGRFSDKRGKFGIIVCRTIEDRAKVLKHCLDIVNDRREFVIVLDDDDIEHLLKLRAARDYEGIDSFMDDKLRELLM